MLSFPIPRTSFLDSRLRQRGRVTRLVQRGLPATEAQVPHFARPGDAAPPAPREAEPRQD